MLATVRRDGIEARGGTWRAEDEEAFKAPIRDAVRDARATPTTPRARLWDDGIIDPARRADVLGLGLSAACNAPIARDAVRRVPDVMRDDPHAS